MMADFMKIFEEFGGMKDQDPASAEVQDQIRKLQSFINEHFYKCSNEILSGLGKMYAGGGGTSVRRSVGWSVRSRWYDYCGSDNLICDKCP